uniref:type IX secretion system motor protein PorL/GldL n=1 Tax=Prevotella sp. TaxID=59823 RepID=UPI0040297F5C
MGEYSKFNIVYRLQKWMDSVPGQTFLNYAYSWGASVVILGTLFKLTHLPGANLMLFAGMGTEVFVFFLSAFDRPFDKTADGRDIPTHVTEEYLETGKISYQENREGAVAQQPVVNSITTESSVSGAAVGGVSGGTVVVGQPIGDAHVGQPIGGVSQQSVAASTVWVGGQQNVTPEMAEAQSNYVDELKKLVETLEKVNEQSARLTRDSEEMENLNRTLTGISKVYEMQLKGASQQIGTIDQINEQSRKMAQQIEQLNKIYTRMIEAMTVNMRAAAPTVNPQA